MDPLVEGYRTGHATGGFDRGIRVALERLLASPDFLFRIVDDPPNARPGTPYRISDLELASRLSFFLWSSIPDDALLDVASRGELGNPSVLLQQTRRMLADPRAEALISNFTGQWLRLRNVAGIDPNVQMFPDFDENLRRAMRLETELLFEGLIRGRSQCARSAGCGLHVHQRAARAALRPSERLRQSLQARAGHRSQSSRHPRSRQHSHGDLAVQPDVSGHPRQVDSGEPAWCATPGAAG